MNKYLSMGGLGGFCVKLLLGYCVIVLLVFCYSEYSRADTGISLGYSQSLGDSDNAPYAKLSWRPEGKPYYVWGTAESTESRLLGQGIAETNIFAAGLGLRYKYEQFYTFGEIGYAYLDQDANMNIQQEVVFTDLVETHHVRNRPIPVLNLTRPYDQESYETVWETENGVTGAVGFGYILGDFSLELAYRPLIVKEHLELYDAKTRANGGGWWQESRNRDYSTIQLGVKYEF